MTVKPPDVFELRAALFLDFVAPLSKKRLSHPSSPIAVFLTAPRYSLPIQYQSFKFLQNIHNLKQFGFLCRIIRFACAVFFFVEHRKIPNTPL
jgi:hypothetical protein